MLSVNPSWRKMGIGESSSPHLRSLSSLLWVEDALDPPALTHRPLTSWELPIHLPDLAPT